MIDKIFKFSLYSSIFFVILAIIFHSDISFLFLGIAIILIGIWILKKINR